jgi:hypothetical protein
MREVSPSEIYAERVKRGIISFVDLTEDYDEVTSPTRTSPKPRGAGANRMTARAAAAIRNDGAAARGVSARREREA